jgi:hypothetical protein
MELLKSMLGFQELPVSVFETSPGPPLRIFSILQVDVRIVSNPGVLKGCASAHKCVAKFLDCAAKKGIGKVRTHKKGLCIKYLSSVTY